MKKRLLLILFCLILPRTAFAQTPDCQPARAALVEMMVEACGMSRRGEVCNAPVDQLDEVESLTAEAGRLQYGVVESTDNSFTPATVANPRR